MSVEVKQPIVEKNKTLPMKTSGNINSKYVLIFLHGWPDTITLFDPLVPSFKTDYYIIQVSFPNFVPGKKLTWGIDFYQTVEYLNNTLKNLNEIQNKEKIFICHDWGCVITYMYDMVFPKQIKYIVALDIGAKFDKSLYFVAYQLYLTVAFLLGGFVGNIMTWSYLKLVGYDPKWKYDSSVNYFYYHMWKGNFKNFFKRKVNQFDKYKPSCPVLFLYGKDKPSMIHNQEWENYLKNTKDCEIHGFDSGHWFFQKYEKEVVELIKKYLSPKL